MWMEVDGSVPVSDGAVTRQASYARAHAPAPGLRCACTPAESSKQIANSKLDLKCAGWGQLVNWSIGTGQCPSLGSAGSWRPGRGWETVPIGSFAVPYSNWAASSEVWDEIWGIEIFPLQISRFAMAAHVTGGCCSWVSCYRPTVSQATCAGNKRG